MDMPRRSLLSTARNQVKITKKRLKADQKAVRDAAKTGGLPLKDKKRANRTKITRLSAKARQSALNLHTLEDQLAGIKSNPRLKKM
tara:strand:- start:1316 stop:1573 length:258 start_codon:yes stop_codon:yes gene_type:complete